MPADAEKRCLGVDAGQLRIEVRDACADDEVRRRVARARERNLQAARAGR